MSEIRYYQKQGQVLKLRAILDIRPELTCREVLKANEVRSMLGDTHWQVSWASGNETVLLPLETR